MIEVPKEKIFKPLSPYGGFVTTQIREGWNFLNARKQLVKIIIGMGALVFGTSYWNFFSTVHVVKWLISIGVPEEEAHQIFALGETLGVICLLIAAIVFGAASDDFRSRWGNRLPFIVGGMLLASTSATVIPIFVNASNAIILVPLTFVLIFLGIGCAISPNYALLSELLTKKERGWGALGEAGFGVIATGIALFLLPILNKINFLLSWFSVSIMLLIGAAIAFALIPKTNPPFDPIDSTLQDIINTPKYLLILGKGDFRTVFFLQIFWGAAIFSVTIYLINYLDAVLHHIKDISVILVLSGVTAAVMAGPTGYLISKIGKVKTAMIGTLIYIVFALSLAFLPTLISLFSENIIFFLVILGSTGAIFITAVQVALPADLVPEGKEAQFMGINYFGLHIGSPIISSLAVYLLTPESPSINIGTFSLRGYNALYFITAICMTIALVLLFSLQYEKWLESKYQEFYKRYLKLQGLLDKAVSQLTDRFM